MEKPGQSPETAEINQPKEIFLEIGGGLDSAAINGNRSFEGNKIYIGVDAARGNYHTQDRQDYGEAVRAETADMHQQIQHEKPDENIHFIFAEGEHLPLPNDSVQEVYMANVVTAPLTHNARTDLLLDVNRVLLPDGKLVLKVNWDVWMWPKEEIKQIIEAAGFGQCEIIDSMTDEANFVQLETTYGASAGIDTPTGYFVTATK